MAEKNHKHVKEDDKYEAFRGKERAAEASNSPDASKKRGEHS